MDSYFSGILEIYIHHARNIHNICIYENQDVYAKFSLTYDPDETFSTKVVNGGGKNPEFNEKIIIKINQFDALLKCEMWMLSRAKNYMEDQLLGFSLVPISLVVGKPELTEDFSLSSTDLFHSPAGTVKLTLSFNSNLPFIINPSSSGSVNGSSISSEVVLLDRKKVSEVTLDPIEYSRIEFPDVDVVAQNQRMVSEYFGNRGGRPAMIAGPPGSFLCLGGACDHDYEMGPDSSSGPVSPDENDNSGFFSSTMTSLGDDRNSADSFEKKNVLEAGESSNNNSNISRNPENAKENNNNTLREKKEVKEESAMQQQIVDMYMRSMQQFTESLAKMKLPMNLEKIESEDHGDVIQRSENNVEVEGKKKDGGRVFYGSRAFF